MRKIWILKKLRFDCSNPDVNFTCTYIVLPYACDNSITQFLQQSIQEDAEGQISLLYFKPNIKVNQGKSLMIWRSSHCQCDYGVWCHTWTIFSFPLYTFHTKLYPWFLNSNSRADIIFMGRHVNKVHIIHYRHKDLSFMSLECGKERRYFELFLYAYTSLWESSIANRRIFISLVIPRLCLHLYAFYRLLFIIPIQFSLGVSFPFKFLIPIRYFQ